MSHTSTVKSIAITNIAALRAAVDELAKSGIKISLIEKATPRAYFSNQAGMGLADYVVQIPDAKYDIGLYKKDDGSYEARTDFYGGTVERVLGATPTSKEAEGQAKMGKLFQMYGVHAATMAARAKGYMVRRQAGENQQIKLVVTGNM